VNSLVGDQSFITMNIGIVVAFVSMVQDVLPRTVQAKENAETAIGRERSSDHQSVAGRIG